MNAIISDPELLIDQSRCLSTADRLAAVQRLYLYHLPAIQMAEQAMEEAHKGYLSIITPVTYELFKRISSNVLSGEDFHRGMCVRSEWLVNEMRNIRQAYERQYGSAYNLVKLM